MAKMMFYFFYLFLFVAFIHCDIIHHQYCIIGAGPGGLQMGYFLQQAGRNYIIFEKGNSTATFFQTYPRHRKLISINKVKTGRVNSEFNMRYDWNSFLSHDDSLLFKKYSADFYPQADVYVRYTKEYQEKLHLAVQFDSDIRNITTQSTSDQRRFTMQDQRGSDYSCSIVVVASGLSKPNLPHFDGWEHVTPYKNISIDPEDYVGKNVLILGRGNSGFETADAIYPKSNVVHMLGRSRPRLSWSTHYVGDVRGINSPILDNYQLKSLDGLLEAPVQYVKLYRKDGRIHVEGPEPSKEPNYWEIFPLRDGYDIVISCLGFSYDDQTLFSESTKPLRGPGRKKKYPLIKPNYEASNIADVFFAGSVAHSLDFRKSSGGFIHGFRYTVQALHRLLEFKYHGSKWPSIRLPIMQLLNVILRRINEGAAMYEMFGALGDVVIFRNETGAFDYLEDLPVRLLPQLSQVTGHQEGSSYLVIILDYGEDFSGPAEDTFREDRATSDVTNAHRSNFLHPILYFYDHLPTEMDFAQKQVKSPLPKPMGLHHILEDFLINWTSETIHVLPLRRFIENSLGLDLRHFSANDCLNSAFTFASVPLSCQQSIFSNVRV